MAVFFRVLSNKPTTDKFEKFIFLNFNIDNIYPQIINYFPNNFTGDIY